MKTLKKIRDSSSCKIGVIILLSVLTVWSMMSSNLVNIHADEIVNITSEQPTGYIHYGQACQGYNCAQFYGQSIDKLNMSDGRVGFCADPSTLVNSTIGYTATEVNDENIANIMYHGYWNTSQSMWDYAVTQLMIWELKGYVPTNHTVPNYAQRKAEIQNLVNSHSLKPSFSGRTYEVNIGDSITLTDTNNVLSQFSNWSAKDCNIQVNGNQLTITPNVDTPDTLTIRADKYKQFYIGASYIYRLAGSQTIQSHYLNDPIRLNINLKVNKYGTGKLIWNKTANVFTHTDTWQTEYGKVETPVYEVENILGSSIDIYTAEDILYRDKKTVILPKETYVATLDSEYDSVALELIAGKYYYVEKDVPNNTILNTDKHYFTIEDTMTSELSETHSTLHNEIPTITFDFTKKLESDHQTTGKEYQDVVFGIYARDKIYDYRGELAIFDNTLLATCGIDEEGHLKDIPILPIGNYFIKELGTNAAYELNTEEYDFSIDQSHDENVEIMINEGKPIVNQLKDFTLRLHKIDEKGNAIKNAPFAFARYEDKECTKLIDLGSVDLENGIQTFHSVHFGISYIKEIENPKGYQKSDHIMKVEVNENGVYVDDKKIEDQEDSYPIYFANDTIVEVKTGDITNMYPQMMIAGVSLIVIVGLSIFLRKKNTH